MDDSRFDQFTRSLPGQSRRSLVKGVLGMALGGLLGSAAVREANAATLRSPGEICRKNGECASGLCSPKDRTGRQRCQCIEGGCNGGTCCEGRCSFPTDPVITVSFTPTSDPFYCIPNLSLSGFAGCTSYAAEYWNAHSSDGTDSLMQFADAPLNTTDSTGASVTTVGSFFNFNEWLDFRITLSSGQVVSGWQKVECSPA